MNLSSFAVLVVCILDAFCDPFPWFWCCVYVREFCSVCDYLSLSLSRFRGPSFFARLEVDLSRFSGVRYKSAIVVSELPAPSESVVSEPDGIIFKSADLNSEELAPPILISGPSPLLPVGLNSGSSPQSSGVSEVLSGSPPLVSFRDSSRQVSVSDRELSSSSTYAALAFSSRSFSLPDNICAR